MSACSKTKTATSETPRSPDPLEFGSLRSDYILHRRVDEVVRAKYSLVQKLRFDDVRTCLAKSGFQISDPLMLFVPEVAANPIEENGSWSAQRAYVDAHGYGIWEEKSISVREEVGTGAQKLPAYQRALSECTTGLRDRIPLDDSAEFDPAVVAEVTKVAAAIEADPGWITARDLWGPCMKARGLKFESHADAVDSLRALVLTGISAERLRAKEIPLARADLECQIGEVYRAQRTIEARLNG